MHREQPGQIAGPQSVVSKHVLSYKWKTDQAERDGQQSRHGVEVSGGEHGYLQRSVGCESSLH